MKFTKKVPLFPIGLIVTLLSLLHSTVGTVAKQGTTQSYLEIGPRVISGKPTTSHKHPHVVRIFYTFIESDGTDSLTEGHGALLTLKWVVTAAHIVYKSHTNGLEVVAGMTYEDDIVSQNANVQYQAVCAYYIHPLYKFLGPNTLSYLNDLAVVKLRGAFRVTPTVRALGFNSIPDYFGDPQAIHSQYKICTAAGWGAVSDGTEAEPFQIQEARLTLVSVRDCARMNLIPYPVDGNLCTHAEHSALYKGDSGTPLMCRGRCFLAVLASRQFNMSHPKAERINVYVRVDFWKGWILDTIANNS